MNDDVNNVKRQLSPFIIIIIILCFTPLNNIAVPLLFLFFKLCQNIFRHVTVGLWFLKYIKHLNIMHNDIFCTISLEQFLSFPFYIFIPPIISCTQIFLREDNQGERRIEAKRQLKKSFFFSSLQNDGIITLQKT